MSRTLLMFPIVLGLVSSGGCRKEPPGSAASKATEADHPASLPATQPGAPTPSSSGPAARPGPRPRVRFTTTMGEFVVELYPDRAPITVANFLRYVDDGFYDQTLVHRVVRRGPRSQIAVIQAGGLTADRRLKRTRPPIPNEANNGLKNLRGTIAMARKRALNSATSQFFINVTDNPLLDYPSMGGYAVFGKVVSGMDVVDKIGAVPTTGLRNEVPVEDIVILSARRVAAPATATAPATRPAR